MTGAATDVFISYKAEDRKRLIPLVEALEAEGFSVWWDQHIGGGTNWREEIETHLDAAKVVLVVWSKLTIGPQGRFVRDEAGQAQEAGHYLPITVDNVRPPLGFREVQALDLSSWWGKRSDPRFKLLADTIRRRLEGGEIGPRSMVLSGPRVDRRTAIAGGIGVAAVASAGGFFLLKPAAANANRIAVLPFANLSGSREDYFADGLAEELRGALSRAGLEVIGRNSSEAVAKDDAASIGGKLKVAHVLTGSVRTSPEKLRVSAQLVDAKDGAESWSQNYDRAPGDSIKIQSDIAEQVASALSVAMGVIKKAVELGGTNDPVAQGYMLQVRETFKKEGITKEALQHVGDLLRKALAKDPNFARAWVSLGSGKLNYAGQYAESSDQAASLVSEGERDIRRGLALAPELADGHAALGRVAAIRLDYGATLSHLRDAFAREPNNTSVLVTALNYLPMIGSIREAEDAAHRLVSLDPFQAIGHASLAGVLDAAGRVDEAITAARKSVELAPNNASCINQLAISLIEGGRYDEALKVSDSLPAGDPFRTIIAGLAAARRGQRAEAEKQMSVLRGLYGDYASYQYAEIHALLGDTELAFAALMTAEKAKDPGLISTMRDPFLKSLRQDPRLLALLKRMKFPVIDPGIGRG